MKTATPRSPSPDYTGDQRQLATYAKALAHPARIAILRFLAQHETCYCGSIVDALPLAQSSVSQHLQALRDSGLVSARAEGTKVCYCLVPSAISLFQNLFTELHEDLAQAPTCDADSCCE